MKTLELFAGIGACSTALKRIGLDVEIVDAVEIDKYAMASFNAVHGTNFEPQDITKWNKELKDIDLITHGSPCQDFSVAGKQAGGDIGSGTRSSLMYETIRIVGQVRPKYVLWENVKNLLSKKHKHNFDAYIETMNILGYNSYYQVLNAKDYGIPQKRERVYTISIRKDIDKGNFVFPEKEELKIRLKDMLEEYVDEKYFLSDKMINFFYHNEQVQKEKGNGFRFGISNGDVVAKSVTTRAGSRMDDNFIKIVNATKKEYNDNMGVVVNEPKIIKPNLVNNDTRLKKLVENTKFEEGKVLNLDTYNQTVNENVSQTLTEPHHNSQRLFDGYRIRKLTPKECWRLMGFSDEDFEKAANIPTSDTQLYKQAGNSIVVNVLEKIFRNLF